MLNGEMLHACRIGNTRFHYLATGNAANHGDGIGDNMN